MIDGKMDLATLLPYIQIALAILLAGGVLLQQTDASLGAAFGGSGGDGVRYTRRGLERTLFQLTIVVAVLFVISVLGSIVIAS
jgi:preprotein translocase subunit SecG